MNRPAVMEDRAIRVPKDAPRPERLVAELRVTFMSFVWKFIGSIIIFSGVANLLAGLLIALGPSSNDTPQSTGWVLAGLGVSMATLAFYLLRRNRRRIAARRRALLEGTRCPARLLSVRKSFGLNLTFLQPDFVHTLDVQLPDHRVIKHQLKLPLDASEQLGERDDLFVLVHLPSGDVFVPDALHHIRWTD